MAGRAWLPAAVELRFVKLKIVLLAVILASPALADPAVQPPDPSHMSLKEIRAWNKTQAKESPFYIKCRRDVEIGSIAKAHTVCRTARDWADADNAGNRTARDTVRLMNETAGNVGN